MRGEARREKMADSTPSPPPSDATPQSRRSRSGSMIEDNPFMRKDSLSVVAARATSFKLEAEILIEGLGGDGGCVCGL